MNKAEAVTLNRLNSASVRAQDLLREVQRQTTMALEAFAEGSRQGTRAANLTTAAAGAAKVLEEVDLLLDAALVLDVDRSDLAAAYRGEADHFPEEG